jgi:hypothetical protein
MDFFDTDIRPIFKNLKMLSNVLILRFL